MIKKDAVHIRRGTDGDLIHTIDHPGYNFELTSKKSNIWSFLQSNVSQIKIFDTKVFSSLSSPSSDY